MPEPNWDDPGHLMGLPCTNWKKRLGQELRCSASADGWPRRLQGQEEMKPMETIADAAGERMVLNITCQRCSRSRSEWAWKFYHRAPKGADLPLRQTVSGFWCTGCKAKVQVYISARREGEL
jgi:hypothetical protein